MGNIGDMYKNFIDSIESAGTKSLAVNFKAIGNYDYTNCSLSDIEEIILSMKPNRVRTITTIGWLMSSYAKFIGDDNLYQLTKQVDRNKLWEMCKYEAPKRFISNSDFETIYHDIGVFEELNSLYYQVLFRAIYEGIYSDRMEFIKNIRLSDIHGNIVTLRRDDDKSCQLEVSNELIKVLKELSTIKTFERKNRYNTFKIETEGLYHDSCFKIEKRYSSPDSYRFAYYRMIRKITKDYLGYQIRPENIYVSGIMHRINMKLKEINIDLEDAFSYHNHSKIVASIISEELERSNYDIGVNSFREIVQGKIEEFLE